ncbi:MAG: AAA domain-containing protein [Gammaproteobacteria bacterium]|nr:AAA domain-containing protein [Gammaproteobacteria bacterium]
MPMQNNREQDIARLASEAKALLNALNEVIYGKPELTRMTMAAFLAGGHVLLEGVPGLGKTVLSKSLAAMTDLDYKRIQFTPDLLPADITGTHILEDTPQGRRMRFMPGPVFTRFLLADEINRASPKTQAALLEAMSEQAVTLMGESRQLEKPFFVMATQNPIEMEGTNPLPEAQLDRFAMKINVAATAEDALLRMIRERKDGNPPPLAVIMSRETLLECQQLADEIFLPEAIAVFIARLVTRTDPGNPQCSSALRPHLRYGASPRGAVWLTRTARALALLDGRSGTGFEDVAEVAPHVLGHRLILNYTAKFDGVTAPALISRLLEETEREVLAS